MRLRSPGAALLCAAGLLSFTRVAAASKPARACIEAHAQGQVERDAGRLLAAHEQFASCAVDTCPALIRRECVELGDAVKAVTPSVVLLAEDSQGRISEGARATIDGALAIPLLDGKPVELDPGEHRFDLVVPDGRQQSLRVSLRQSEKYRRIVASFPAEPAPRVSARRSVNPLAYVLGGVGVLGLGAWAGFALDGRHRENQLEKCAPHCERGDVNAMRKSYLIADVLLGVSVASLGAGTYLFVRKTEEPSGDSALWLGASGRF